MRVIVSLWMDGFFLKARSIQYVYIPVYVCVCMSILKKHIIITSTFRGKKRKARAKDRKSKGLALEELGQ